MIIRLFFLLALPPAPTGLKIAWLLIMLMLLMGLKLNKGNMLLMALLMLLLITMADRWIIRSGSGLGSFTNGANTLLVGSPFNVNFWDHP
jgi:hypothetical protein